MPRGGARQGSGPKPLSAQGKVAGPRDGHFSLTAREAEALTEILEERGTWYEAGSKEWQGAVNALAREMMKAGIHALPQYQATQDNTAHMAALNSREQVDE